MEGERHEIRFSVDEKLALAIHDDARKATLSPITRHAVWAFPAAFVLGGTVLTILGASDKAWAAVAAGLIGGTVMLSVTLLERRNVRKHLRSQEPEEVLIAFGDDGIYLRSRLAEGTTKWPAYNKCMRGQVAWFLAGPDGAAICIPLVFLPEEARRFVEEKCRVHGIQLAGR